MDVLSTPNTGGESFGIVVTEGMAAGTPVVASDLEAFRAVLQGDDGSADAASGGDGPGTAAGVLFPTGNPGRWPRRWPRCSTTQRRAARGAAAQVRAAAFDWPVVAAECCGSTAPPSPPTPAGARPTVAAPGDGSQPGTLVPALTPTGWAIVVGRCCSRDRDRICVGRARRLDRLHRRTDAARAGLADALDRRGEPALRWPTRWPWLGVPGAASDAAVLRDAAHHALDACRVALR